MRCIHLDTPASIQTRDSEDVFDSTHVLSGNDPESARYQKMYAALWARFRYRALGHTDKPYWIQCMKDRYAEIKATYAEKFDVYEAYLETEYTDLAEGSSKTVYKHEDVPDTATTTAEYLDTRDTTDNKVYAGLPQTTVKAALQDVQDPYADFAREFDALFYWGL